MIFWEAGKSSNNACVGSCWHREVTVGPLAASARTADKIRLIIYLEHACLRRLRSDLLNPKFGNQKSALL